MKLFFNLLLLGTALLASISCTAQQTARELKFGRRVLLLLDSSAASHAIVYDKTDRFFQRVNASEMSIQMKTPLAAGASREALLSRYVEYMKQDVDNFTPSEMDYVGEVMQHVYQTCDGFATDIMPDTLRLIKTKANHYGPSVYYTREKCIVIPQNALEDRKKKEFTGVMFHETFHVYSRTNPSKRARLYRLIGFDELGFERLNMPQSLAERVLLNPDGVNFAQKITLQHEGKTIHAVPIIYSSHVGFSPAKHTFFEHLGFSLYEVTEEAGGNWRVVTQADGYSSTLDLRKIPDFFRQIRDNTGYIIHPDEVLADNFSFIMMAQTDPAVTAKFSAPGKELIAEIEKIIRGSQGEAGTSVKPQFTSGN